MKLFRDIYASYDDNLFGMFFFLLYAYLRKKNYTNRYFRLFFDINKIFIIASVSEDVKSKMLLKFIDIVMNDIQKLEYVPNDTILRTIILKRIGDMRKDAMLSPLHQQMFMLFWLMSYKRFSIEDTTTNMFYLVMGSDDLKDKRLKKILSDFVIPESWLSSQEEEDVDKDS